MASNDVSQVESVAPDSIADENNRKQISSTSTAVYHNKFPLSDYIKNVRQPRRFLTASGINDSHITSARSRTRRNSLLLVDKTKLTDLKCYSNHVK